MATESDQTLASLTAAVELLLRLAFSTYLTHAGRLSALALLASHSDIRHRILRNEQRYHRAAHYRALQRYHRAAHYRAYGTMLT